MSELLDSDVQILCAIQNTMVAHAMLMATNNFSLATSGVPGTDPFCVFGPEFYRLSQEAKARGLIVEKAEVKP